MSLEEVQVSSLIPASPNAIYAAWMDSRRHSAITGSVAVINPWVGGRVTARARFIEATHVKLETGKRILLAWRTQDFPADAPDSQVDVLLQPAAGGTKVSIQHSQIPAGHAAAAREIWRSLYLDPMKRYFGKTGAMEAAHRAATRAGQMPTADMVGMRHARTPITSAGTVSAPSVTSTPSEEPRDKPRRVILRKKKDGVATPGADASAPRRPSRLVAAMAALMASGDKGKAPQAAPAPAAAKPGASKSAGGVKAPEAAPPKKAGKPADVAAVKGAPAKAAAAKAAPVDAAPAAKAAKAPVKVAAPAKANKPVAQPPKSPAKPASAKTSAKPVAAKKPAPAAKKPAKADPKKPTKKVAPAPKKPVKAAATKPAPKKAAPKAAVKKAPAPKAAVKKAPAPKAKKHAPKKAAPKAAAKKAPAPKAKKPAPKAKPIVKKAPAPKAKKPAPKKGRR